MAWEISAFSDEAGDACEQQIAALQQAGLKRMDLRSVDGHNISVLPVEQAKTVRAKLDAAGIRVAMFGSPVGKIDIADDVQSDLQKLRHMGELAPVLGCNAIRMFSYYNKKKNLPHAQWQAETLTRLGQLRDLASQLGLVLYHENECHIFGDLCQDVLAIARELRQPKGAFRMIFDFDNYNQSGENVWENWLKLRDFTDAIHLKDSKNRQHVPVGQGTGCVKEILADAVKRGWSGPLSVEPHLSHSGAVAATGPSGSANQEYSKMSRNESFQIACKAAVEVLRQAGANFN